LLAFEMAAFLGKLLVLDVNPGNAAALEFAHRAEDVELVAVAGVGIGDDRQLDGGGDAPGIGTISDIVTRPKSGYPRVAAVPAPVM
jgi:hypothetical protein